MNKLTEYLIIAIITIVTVPLTTLISIWIKWLWNNPKITYIQISGEWKVAMINEMKEKSGQSPIYYDLNLIRRRIPIIKNNFELSPKVWKSKISWESRKVISKVVVGNELDFLSNYSLKPLNGNVKKFENVLHIPKRLFLSMGFDNKTYAIVSRIKKPLVTVKSVLKYHEINNRIEVEFKKLIK